MGSRSRLTEEVGWSLGEGGAGAGWLWASLSLCACPLPPSAGGANFKSLSACPAARQFCPGSSVGWCWTCQVQLHSPPQTQDHVRGRLEGVREGKTLIDRW